MLGEQIPGGEDSAYRTLNEIITLINPEFVISHGALAKQKFNTILSEGGFEVAVPFLRDVPEPKVESVYTGTHDPSPQ